MALAAPLATGRARAQEPASEASSSAWLGSAGWEVSVDGQAKAGRHGVFGQLGVIIDGWLVDATAVYGFADAAEEELATIDVSRHGLHLGVGRGVALNDSLQGLGGWRVGALYYFTSSVAEDPRVESSEKRHAFRLVGGPWIRLLWLVDDLVLSVAGGADGLTSRVSMGYTVDGTFVPSRSPWRIQPWIALSMGSAL